MRRRMIMNGSKDKIKMLRQMGCLLWLPLDEEYGLEAAIGDTRLEPVDGYILWNEGVGMYEFRLQQVGVISAKLRTPWSESDFSGNKITVMSQARRYTTTSYRSNINILKFETTVNINVLVANYAYNGRSITNNSAQYIDDRVYSSFVTYDYDTSKRHIYAYDVERVYDTSDNLDLTSPNAGDYLLVEPTAASLANKRFFAKNIMVFNKILSAQRRKKVLRLITEEI